ncbi:MAG: hypothetical protein ABSG86_30110 [Thermoguttaceae bacterium]
MNVTDPAEAATRSIDILSRLRPLTRILFPGVAVALFIYLRYDAPVFKGFGSDSLPSIALSLLLGTLVYFTYRALVLPVVWFLQARTPIGMPARETHKRIVDSINSTLHHSPVRDSVLFSQACLDQFQVELLTKERKAETTAYNSGSHILYLTATLGIGFLLHDLAASLFPVINAPQGLQFLAWTLMVVLGLAAAIVYDRSADYREVIMLWRHEQQYRELLDAMIKSWMANQEHGRLKEGLKRGRG